MEKFKHNCANAQEMIGYSKALNDMFLLIQKQTGATGEIRYIDALPLVEAISNTNDELITLLKGELTETERDLLTQETLS